MRVGEILLPLPSAVFATALRAAETDLDVAMAKHRVTVNGKQLMVDLQRAPGSKAVEIQ